MRNSAVKRIIAVLLCLVVFAGSELTGLTNIVGDLFAEESTTGTDDGDRENVVEDVEVEEASEEPQEEPEEVTEEQPEETSEPQEEETVSEESEEIQEPQETVTDVEDDVTEEDNNESDPEPAETEDNGEPGEPAVDPEKKADAEEEKTEENTAAEEADKTQTDASVTDDTKLPTDEEQTTAPETVTDPTEEDQKEKKEDEEEPEAFNEEYQDGQVIIRVEADPGVVPNGTELSVKKIVQQDLEALDDEEEIKEAEELNAKYEGIKSELELTVADDDTKEIAGFVAYDVNFLLTDEDGETAEIEPDGEVSVSMEFEEAYLPEEVAEKEDQIDIESIDVIHMEEAEDDEESETGLKSEVVADADVSTTENAVEKAEFTTDSGRTFVITWTENDLGEREYICETEDAVIKVTAAKGVVPDGALLKVVPILADHQETQKQYQDVEKKLLEKAETEKYEIAGFLAYDISFIDEAGAKLEPTGEVKVAIDYKKAAIPEDLKDLTSTTYALDDADDAEDAAKDDAEEAAEASGEEEKTLGSDASQSDSPASAGSITVMHLEENDQGQVTKVVDMGAEGKVTELISTKDQKVTSTEFVTESFSTFTIVWKNEGISTAININICDLDGNAITLSDESLGLLCLELDLTHNEFNISEIKKDGADIEKKYYQLTDVNGVSYIFDQALFFGNFIKSLKYVGNQIFVVNGWDEETSYDSSYMPALEFRYKENVEEEDNLPKIDTIDNDDYGITMKMINYTSDTPQYDLLGAKKDWWIDANTGTKSRGDLTQGAVEKRLNEEGYPVSTGLKDGSKKGKSLAPLFGGGGSGVITQNANHLFSQDIYERTGYFEYSSFENYAYLKDNGDFAVYQVIGTPSDENQPYYQRGNFLPYNKIREGRYSSNRNWYGPDGKRLTGGREGELLYKPVDQVDYAFGMYIEATFSQPQNGQVTDSDGRMSDMTYNFNGDDDLWVFIDDSLILDIGGSHHARSGWINFADGTVHIEEKDIADTNIRRLFFESGYFPDGNPWTDEDDPKADDYFKGNTFADYSTHTVKMFYMERGGEASNLHVSMNLPTVQKKTVEVEKQLSTNRWKYKDVEFAFQVLAKKTGEDLSEGEVVETVNGVDYVILNQPFDKKTQQVIPVTNIKEGEKEYKNVFYLKPGEVAQFRGLDENREYFVREIGLKPDEYDHVTIRGTSVDEGEIKNGIAESDIYTVSEWPRVVYLNECADANSNELHIKKVMSDGSVPEDKFTFKVTLGGKEFTDPYYLKIDDSSEWQEMPAPTDGVIGNIPANGTIKIDKLLTGTELKVEEIGLNEEEYTLANITGNNVENGVYASESSSFTGKIVSDKDAMITVTNAPKGATDGGITITKQLQEGSPEDKTPFVFRVSLTDKDGKAVTFQEYTLDDAITPATDGKVEIPAGSIATIKAPTAVSFEVKEILREGYDTPDIKVDGQALSDSDDPMVAKGSITAGSYANIVVTNIPKPTYTWEIVKQSSTGDQPLGGAKFKLESQGGKTTYFGLSDKDANGVVKWYSEEPDSEEKAEEISNFAQILQAGSYTLTETNPPVGFNKVEGSWTITIEDGKVPEIKGNVDATKNALGTSKTEGTKTTFYIKNDVVLYELPSTGGAGIFGYMISGVLLMMAGVLILYKRKYAGRC